MLIRPRSVTVDLQGLMATGYLYYIGQPFTDGRLEQNQLDLFDAATGQPISNPVAINGNGDFINDNSQVVTPRINETAYSLVIVGPNGGVLGNPYPNIESDTVSLTSSNDIVDQVYDYLALAQQADLSAFDHVYVRSELQNDLDPTDGGFYVKDGTTGTPSTGDINKFFDSEGNGWLREHDQRFSEDLDVIVNRNYQEGALVRGTIGNLSTQFENVSGGELVGDLSQWRAVPQRLRVGGLTPKGGITQQINFGLGIRLSICPVREGIIYATTDNGGELNQYSLTTSGILESLIGQPFTWNDDPFVSAYSDNEFIILNALELQLYDDRTFATVGNPVTLPGRPRNIVLISPNKIAFSLVNIFYVYSFDGADWTQESTFDAGSSFNMVDTLTENRVLMDVGAAIYTYDDDAMTWSVYFAGDPDYLARRAINTNTFFVAGLIETSNFCAYFNGDSLRVNRIALNLDPSGAQNRPIQVSNGIFVDLLLLEGTDDLSLSMLGIDYTFYDDEYVSSIINGT